MLRKFLRMTRKRKKKESKYVDYVKTSNSINLFTKERKMSSTEILSMDITMEDSDSFVSHTDAIIYGTSDYSKGAESLISDLNIPSSSSTSADEYQQQISTAAGVGTDDDCVVSSCASSSSFKNNNEQSVEHREIKIFNVDFRALSEASPTDKSNVVDNPTAASEFQMPTSRPLVENAVTHQSQMNLDLFPLLHVSSESLMPVACISVYPHHRYSSVRIRWTTPLHARFVHAVELLGGLERATPKSILELMAVRDLNLAHVKTHLQKYRTVKLTLQ